MRAIIQVPINPELKTSVEKKAKKDGFTSLQQVVRLFLSRYNSGRLEVGFEEQFPPVQLSARAIKRYDKMNDDFEKGKNVYIADSVDDLMDQLHGRKRPVPYKVSKSLQKTYRAQHQAR